jgi:hypothetical protein
MVTHMKTTIEIATPLLDEARAIAVRDHVTLRELVEQGLRAVLEERRTQAPYRLRKASFRGRGLHPELGDASWEQLRELAYQGRGGR